MNLGYRGFYTDKSALALIYRQFIQDFVLELSNQSSVIDADINDMFNLEKDIAKVYLLIYFTLISIAFISSSIIKYSTVIHLEELYEQQ